MPRIDTFTVTSFMGRLHKASRKVTRLEPMPGIDGNVVVRSAWRAIEDVVKTSVTVTGSAQTAQRLRDAYRALVGEVVNVLDQFGESWSCTVLDVVPEISTTPFASTYRVVATWRLLPETTEAP